MYNQSYGGFGAHPSGGCPISCTPIGYGAFGGDEAPPTAPPTGADPKKGAWLKTALGWVWEQRDAIVDLGKQVFPGKQQTTSTSTSGGTSYAAGSSAMTASGLKLPGVMKPVTTPTSKPTYGPLVPAPTERPAWVVPVGVGIVALVGLRLARVI